MIFCFNFVCCLLFFFMLLLCCCFCAFCFRLFCLLVVVHRRSSCARLGDSLKPGIHTTMSLKENEHPTTIAMKNDGKQVVVRVALFYWPVDDAFDIHSINRSNTSCFYLRTLHEICDCVMIESSMNEV